MSLCLECGDWPAGEGDAFCGGCGAFLGPAPSLGVKATPGGGAPLIRAEKAQPPFTDIPFGLFSLEGDQEREIRAERSLPGEYEPGGKLVVLPPGGEQALQLRALTGRGDKRGRATNVLDRAIFRREGSQGGLSVGLVERLVDFAGAYGTRRGWKQITIEVANRGPSLLIASARLRVDGVAAGEEDFPDAASDTRVLLPRDGRILLEAWITDDELAVLNEDGRPRTGRIDLTLVEQFDLVLAVAQATSNLTVADRAYLFCAREAGFVVELAKRVRGRAGQRARIGAVLRNTGGSVLTVRALTVTLDGQALETPMPLEWRRPIDPGEEAFVELRPQLPAKDGAATLRLSVEAISEDGAELDPATDAKDARINPAETCFKGWICIDFGTSESGAAAMPDDGKPAIVIDLGRVPLRHDPEDQQLQDRSGRFLPTVVVEMADGGFKTGDDAALFVQAHELTEDGHPWPETLERPKEVATEFKWLLDDGQKDGGARGQNLAAAYLKVVKELIENHPAVAAAIDGETRVCATRPTVFDQGRTERLLAAFDEAGFGDPRITLVSGEQSLIAESWSPLHFVLQSARMSDAQYKQAMLPLDRGLSLQAIPEPDDPARDRASAWLLVCDVGAGSADFSVVEIAPKGKHQAVRERGGHTDLAFVGREFWKLTTEVLIDWAVEERRSRGLASTGREALAKAIGARRNSPASARAAFRRAVQALQYHPGILSEGYLQLELERVFPSLIAGRMSIQDVAKVASQSFAPKSDARRAARAYLPIELLNPDGAPLVIDTENLGRLVEMLVERFLKQYAGALPVIIDGLLERSGLDAYLEARPEERKAQLVRIVPSGRGGAFPLARLLIYAAVARLTDEKASYSTLEPVASKSITSWGGLSLARRLEDRMFRFRIDLGAQPLSAGVLVGRGVDDIPDLVELERIGPVVAARLSTVAERHVDFEGSEELELFELGDPPRFLARVALTEAAKADPDQWWLYARRAGLAIQADLLEAQSADEVLTRINSTAGGS
ncbi:hypothetical protein QO010_003522 [Caulobacter ginsengisoli]|uniref:Molecular chaperone DnaK n=1 Tax=Caulobacter ginsengisoli TaxID=400775 RepID=A0ABU0IUN7_9CAUL|nr:hypothetical protein [Caulobacter ginsengisoli]MDQ0465730.1 hypothetical protein [Caulobacter ginsengisoli]